MYVDPFSKRTGEVNALQAEAAITFKDISKVFTSRAGATPVIDKLNLEIGEGEFFSLLGPSGCGKTTALRMIAGLEHPSGGELLLGRNPVTGIPPHKRDVNIVFQSYALFPHMGVYDNIEYGLRRKGVARLERRRRVEEVFDLVQLRDLSKRRPAALSGGQQQRVATWSVATGRRRPERVRLLVWFFWPGEGAVRRADRPAFADPALLPKSMIGRLRKERAQAALAV